jgi:hypothetical protein
MCVLLGSDNPSDQGGGRERADPVRHGRLRHTRRPGHGKDKTMLRSCSRSMTREDQGLPDLPDTRTE